LKWVLISYDLFSPGNTLDLKYGGDFYLYYKDNGGGVWAVLAMLSPDGVESTSDEVWWYSYLATTDPTSVVADVTSYIPDTTAVDNDSVATEYVQVAANEFAPDEDAGINDISYTTQGAPYLKNDNGYIVADVVTSMGNVATGKLVDSQVAKTYYDSEIADAKVAANNSFNDGVVAVGSSDVQGAIEALASENDTQNTNISNLQTQDTTHSAYIADNTAVCGVSQGEDNLGVFSESYHVFLRAVATPTTDPVSLREAVGNLSERISEVYQNMGTTLGLASQETDFGTGFTILSNNADAKTLYQEIEAQLQNLAQGLGQFWGNGVNVVSLSNVTISNPGTDTFEGITLIAGDADNDKILLSAQTDASENGLYEFEGSGVAMVRCTDADADADFSPNKTVQDLATGDTWAYTGEDEPVLGTDDLTFQVKSRAVVADDTITEQKLAPALETKINDKADRYEETGITLVANTPKTITHNLGVNIPTYTVYNSTNDEVDVEFDIVDSNNVTIEHTVGGSNFKIVVI